MNDIDYPLPARLDQVEQEVRARLTRAAQDRRSAMHTPIVGTADGDLRVMVLRHFDAVSWTLRFHTDARSPKLAAIAEDASLGILFYDPDARIQIRAKGHGRIETSGALADEAWAKSNNFARRCYLAQAAPGTVLADAGSGLPPEVEGVEPSDQQLLPARANFALLLVDLDQVDWLHLAHTGHRRAQLTRCGGQGAWLGNWVLP